MTAVMDKSEESVRVVEQPVRLNVGAGDTVIEGFIPIDIKTGNDAQTLMYPDASVDEVYASHVLEHFPMESIQRVVNEWVRVLKPGGRLRVAVPDLEWWAKELLAGNAASLGILYGGQTDGHDFHKSGFNAGGLSCVLARAGLTGIQRWNSFVNDCTSLPCSLNMEGFKPHPVKRAIAVVRSIPSVIHSAHQKCVELGMLGLPVHSVTGAYWNQCLERAMEDEVIAGHEWIVTMDFDTLFTPQQFDRLCVLLDQKPHIDAIAPLQMKRGKEGHPLLRPAGDPEGVDELIPVEWAHFGLTIIRSSGLKKLAHPWFKCEEGPDGRWREGRKDADISFWEKWRAAGNTVYVASRVPVGHLQQVATWPGEGFEPIHQHVDEFWEQGPPKGVRW